MAPLADHGTSAHVLIPVAIGATMALAIVGSIVGHRILLDLPPDVLDEVCPPPPRAHAFARRVVGVTLVALGVALLVLPGPGVLFIGLGLLVCAPGWRRRIVRETVTRPRVLGAINAFRLRHGRQELMHPAGFRKGPAHVERVAHH